MEGKKSLQKVAPEDFQRLLFQESKELEEQSIGGYWDVSSSWEKGKGKESSKDVTTDVAEGGFSGAIDSSSFGSCSTWHKTRMKQCPRLPGRLQPSGRKENWWSADLEGEVEKLEVEGGFSGAEGGSVDPTGMVDHWSARIKTTNEGSGEVKGV